MAGSLQTTWSCISFVTWTAQTCQTQEKRRLSVKWRWGNSQLEWGIWCRNIRNLARETCRRYCGVLSKSGSTRLGNFANTVGSANSAVTLLRWWVTPSQWVSRGIHNVYILHDVLHGATFPPYDWQKYNTHCWADQFCCLGRSWCWSTRRTTPAQWTCWCTESSVWTERVGSTSCRNGQTTGMDGWLCPWCLCGIGSVPRSRRRG